MLHIKKIDPQRAGLVALFCGDISSIHILEAIWPPGAPPLLLWGDTPGSDTEPRWTG